MKNGEPQTAAALTLHELVVMVLLLRIAPMVDLAMNQTCSSPVD
jgi:hypothetical protein